MTAAFAVPLVCSLGYSIIDLSESREVGAHVFAIVFATMAFFVLGWPLALVLGAPIAILLGADLQAGKISARRTAIVSAALIGAVSVPIVWSNTGEPNPHSIMMITGALAGLAAGAVLCYYADERHRQQ